MLAAMRLNANRNREGNKDDGARFNACGLVGGQQGHVNHCRPLAYADDSKDENGGYKGYQREARRNRDQSLKVDIPSFSGTLDIESLI